MGEPDNLARPLVEIKERLNLACGSAPHIIRAFDNQFGNVEWKDGDKICNSLPRKFPAKLALTPPTRTR
jgi:hypothetical protein